MIVDSHAHAFPSMGGPAGHASTREHMRYVQHLLMFHHQPISRVDDNSRYDGPNLLWDGKDYTIDNITDVNYRGGGFGKFAFTAGGVDYSSQYLPPALADLEASPELMLAQMDYTGVDRAVFHTGHAYGRLNGYLSDAVKKYPERFWGMAMIDEWKADQESEMEALDHAINELGLHGLWFQSSNLRQHHRTEKIDDPVFFPFWDQVRDMGIPVYWYITSPIPGRDSYLEELAAYANWQRRYSDVPVMFTHGLPLARFMENGRISIPEEAWQAMDSPNTMIELLIPIFQGAIWEYPFVEAQPVVREYYNRFGAERLAWASDMPNVERHCTYKQCMDYLRHCDFIPSGDLDLILGDNVARLFGQ